MLRIEEIMKEKNIGVTELANILNVNRQTVYYYIKQDEKNPVSQLKKIAGALDVSVPELFEQAQTDTINCPHCGGIIKVGKG
jgi:transcriptional regulator with XRE-family HTH domain